MDEALIPFLMMGCPILHEYTSTALAQRYSLVATHTYKCGGSRKSMATKRLFGYTFARRKTENTFEGKMGPVDHSLGPDEYNTLLRPGQQLSSKVQRAHCHGVPELE